jgi:hypothetical protein
METHSICPIPLHRLPVATLAVVLAACGGATGPEDGGMDYTVMVTLKSVNSPAICEEAFTDLDGGEFVWRVTVTWPDSSQDLLDATPNFPSLGGFRSMLRGQSMPINKSVSRTLRVEPVTSLVLGLVVSEVDFDIFGGNPRADARMDRADAFLSVVYDESGWWQGETAHSVNPVTGCAFAASYTVTVTP